MSWNHLPRFGLIIFGTMVVYLAATVAITEWRTMFRREMNLAENDQRTKGLVGPPAACHPIPRTL